MVSAYATSKFFSVIAITTASGFIRFPCIGNYEEIANILQQLLNERQKKTETQENSISQQSNSKNLDNLVKLKNLLDNGIITQEEFETKKKEILKL
ncbi:MAG: SHOCT domain-containing protein [Clostridiales bacterium]|nr:SHOCT domain-containing protein [Clostridiales bacterium]